MHASQAERQPTSQWLNCEKTILIVEDDPSAISFLQHILSNLNLNSVVKFSATDANEFIRSNKVDLIILDWNLSGSRALDILHDVTNVAYLDEIIPVVFYTANIDEVVLPESPCFEVFDCLSKRELSYSELTKRLLMNINFLGL